MSQVSGSELIRFLERELGYGVIRQRGSHVIMQKRLASGKNTVAIPLKKTIAKGTLNDILAYVAIANGISKEDLLEKLGS